MHDISEKRLGLAQTLPFVRTPLIVFVRHFRRLTMHQLALGRLDAALDCPPGAEYDEDAFLYFLGVERARAGRSKDSLRLLFASLEPVPGKPLPIPPDSAAKLFEGLRQSLRETDVMGWYRQGRVAGAVLAAPPGSPMFPPSDVIERRVGEDLRKRLPDGVARSLRVRIIKLWPQPAAVGNA